MLRRLLTPGREERAITYQSLFLTDQMFAPSSLAGVQMSPATATKIGTVYAAVRLIADSIATLPIDTFRRIDGERVPFRPRPLWVDQPDADPSVPRSDFYQTLIFSTLLTGNGYARILRSGEQVLGFRILDPMHVETRLNGRGFIEFVYNSSVVIPAEDMVHITDMRKPGALKGFSRVDELKDVLGIARALDEFSALYFRSGTLSSGIISTPGDLTAEQADRLKDQFEKNSKGLRNAHRPNVLSGGAKYEKLGDDAAQAQLVEAKRDAVEMVARIFKVQPAMLGVTTPGSMSYDSVEQQHIQFVTLCLRPIVHKIEEAFGVLLPNAAFMRFNLDGLLRGDLQSRYSAYSQGIQAGFLSINDIHRLEDRRPVDGGDVYRVPLSHVDLDAAGVVEQDKRISMAVRLINVGFEPEAALEAVGLPRIPHSGLPSVQLQNAAQHVEADVDEVYPPSRSFEDQDEQRDIAGDIATALAASLKAVQPPVVNVNMPDQPARVRTVQRDEDGNIVKIVEE
jgi:HK97 family phage portal protein